MPSRRGVEPADTPPHGRLAAAALADEAEGLALPQVNDTPSTALTSPTFLLSNPRVMGKCILRESTSRITSFVARFLEGMCVFRDNGVHSAAPFHSCSSAPCVPHRRPASTPARVRASSARPLSEQRGRKAHVGGRSDEIGRCALYGDQTAALLLVHAGDAVEKARGIWMSPAGRRCRGTGPPRRSCPRT